MIATRQCAFYSAVERCVNQLKAQYANALVGIVVGGSFVYGTPFPDSDVDVQVVVDGDVAEDKRFQEICGILFDIAAYSIRDIKRILRMENHNNGYPLEIFALGRIVVDTNAELAQVCSDANKCYQLGPASPPQAFIERKWRHLSQWLDRAQLLFQRGDVSAATLLANATMTDVVWLRTYELRQWNKGIKKALCVLRMCDPQFTKRVEGALLELDLLERVRLLQGVVADYGGGRSRPVI